MREDFIIEFYEKDNGETPFLDFVNKLDNKCQIKIARSIDALRLVGNNVARNYSKKISDNIYELKVQFNSNYIRLLYFYHNDKTIVITNGFIKKTNKTPSREIEKAKQYRLLWLRSQNEK